MPTVRYLNQTAPFWDFIANLEEQGSQHPLFGNGSNGNNAHPWAWAWGGPNSRPWPRGPHQHPHREGDNGEGPSNGPAPPAEGDHPPPPPGPDGHPPPPPPGPHGHPAPPHEHEGPFPHRPHPHHHRGRSHERRGRRHGPWGRGPCSGFPLNDLSAFFNSPLFNQDASSPSTTNNNTTPASTGDFAPSADVFDTESSFVIHVSLPGAKKEDVGVNWDAEKSELSVAGVVYRPGDEDFLKTLALDERRVGAFERKIRLGSRANPAQVDADAINAKLEDGILRVEVPKLDRDYVEIRKVDIE